MEKRKEREGGMRCNFILRLLQFCNLKNNAVLSHWLPSFSHCATLFIPHTNIMLVNEAESKRKKIKMVHCQFVLLVSKHSRTTYSYNTTYLYWDWLQRWLTICTSTWLTYAWEFFLRALCKYTYFVLRRIKTISVFVGVDEDTLFKRK